jgi:hypothetical protein
MVGDPAIHPYFEAYGHWAEHIAGAIGVILVIAVGKYLASRREAEPMPVVDIGPDAASMQQTESPPADRKAE